MASASSQSQDVIWNQVAAEDLVWAMVKLQLGSEMMSVARVVSKAIKTMQMKSENHAESISPLPFAGPGKSDLDFH